MGRQDISELVCNERKEQNMSSSYLEASTGDWK